MKFILKPVILAMVLSCGSGCTTGYWKDRGRDAADVFTVTLGVGLGAKARIGPVQTGLILEFPLVGLRGGECSADNDLDTLFSAKSSASGEAIGFLIGEEEFYMVERDRHKEFHAESIPFWGTEGMFVYGVKDEYSAPYYYTQLEVVLALGPSVRLGFNPGEFLDLFLGLVGVDIYDDDLARREND